MKKKMEIRRHIITYLLYLLNSARAKASIYKLLKGL